MAGGLEIIGLLALLVGACELLRRWLDRRALRRFERSYADEFATALCRPCPWPINDGEVQVLRDRGAL